MTLTKQVAAIAFAVIVTGCASVDDIKLPSPQEITSALQATFDRYTSAGDKSNSLRLTPKGTAPQVSSLEVTKWELIEDAYLVADVQVVLSPKDTATVQADPQSANFRLLLERRESSWVLLDLVPITEPRIVET